MEISENAMTVLLKRYVKKGPDGKPVETVDELFHRVSENIALADGNYGASAEEIKQTAEKFYRMMTSLEFLPNSPTLMNAGGELQQLSGCFVLPVEDDLSKIYDTIKNTALIHQSGGGTGFSFSRLRPATDIVGSTGGIASGPVSFMKVFDASTEQIKQGGTRRGANMGMLRCDHPDILEFIACKDKEGDIANFNISVAVTGTFMEALEKDTTYPLINPRDGETVREIRAQEVFDKIVDQAWKNGEPGVIFIDKMNDGNPTLALGEYEATNPCGEQPLLPYESCNLGSINLSLMVDNGEINWNRLSNVIESAVNFLDNVIDMNRYPLPLIGATTKDTRKIGLGVMGWADMLLKLRIRYSSEEAVELAGKVMSFIHENATSASGDLARERSTYPAHKSEDFATRNAAITTIAPTGSISIIAGCSSGIEPVFAWQGKSEQAGEVFEWEHPLFSEVKCQDEFLPECFVTASQISVEWHIRMQAAFQKYTDNAVSKTINLPNDASREDVAKAYLMAYKLGCKGITVYRDGSRQIQVHTRNGSDSGSSSELPDVMDEKRVRIKTKEGAYYFHVSHMDGDIKEVFVTVPPTGDSRPFVECISRLISQALRHGVPYSEMLEQLYKSYLQYGDITSPLLALNKGLQKALESLGKNVQIDECPCPDCGGVLILEEGCVKCYSCGYSKC